MTGKPKALELSSMVLRLDGIANDLSDDLVGDGFIQDGWGNWRPLIDDSRFVIEEHCLRLYEGLAKRIFGSLDSYYALLPTTPFFLAEAGLNSESNMGRDDFEKLIQVLSSAPEINKFLYLYDCHMLVSAIQECTNEVGVLTCEFYRILNLDPLFTPEITVGDEVRWSTSPVVTNLTATLGFLFIRMHSLLDYLSKLAREVDCLKSDFTTYPRLASSNFLFGDRRRLSLNQRKGSLFEECDEVTEVQLVRNLLIHDGLLDSMPKAYQVIRDGKTVEKFILMPDRKDARFERFNNRRLFYSREDKINLRLAGLVRAFQARQAETLKGIIEVLNSTEANA